MAIACAVDYDAAHDVLYLYSPSKKVEECIEPAEDVILDLDLEGEIIGVEFLSASEFFRAIGATLTPDILSKITRADIEVVPYRNYRILRLTCEYRNHRIQTLLPAFPAEEMTVL